MEHYRPASAALPCSFFWGASLLVFLVGVAMGATWSGFLFWCIVVMAGVWPGAVGRFHEIVLFVIGVRLRLW